MQEGGEIRNITSMKRQHYQNDIRKSMKHRMLSEKR